MKCPWKIEYFLEDLFLGSQWSIILRYRRLSDKSKTSDWHMRIQPLFGRGDPIFPWVWPNGKEYWALTYIREISLATARPRPGQTKCIFVAWQ
jgi:hypothetical protein